MKENGASRLVNSPLLFMALLGAFCGILFSFYKAHNTSFAPDLPEYRLSDKQEVVVICYRPGCGCEAHTVIWTGEAIRRHKTTLVLAHQWEPDLAYIKKEYGPQGALVLTNVKPDVVERFSPSGQTTVALVQKGRIVRRATGDGALQAVIGRAEEARE